MRIRKLLATQAPAAVILVRLTVGAVFLSEGIQKFLSRRSWASDGSRRSAFRRPSF
jgi:uncharacterized membrane protein YphA (DoxX/SURF4 family)